MLKNIAKVKGAQKKNKKKTGKSEINTDFYGFL